MQPHMAVTPLVSPPADPGARKGEFDQNERRRMLQWARESIARAVGAETVAAGSCDELAPKFLEVRACFITLREQRALRGCVGHIFPEKRLWDAIRSNACAAASRDRRFLPLTAGELTNVEIEISILGPLRPLSYQTPEELLAQLQPPQDGVVLKAGSRVATYLPQVWADLPDKELFLSSLAEKAGCDANVWRTSEASVSVYQVEAFKDSEY